MRRVAIVQPYVPRYRVPFFDGLATALHAHDVELTVVAGQPSSEQSARGDAAAGAWLATVPTRQIRIGSRHIVLTNSRRWWRDADAVIVPHQGTSLDALSALALRHGSQRIGVWGHIAPYTSRLNPIDGAIERWQLRRADHVFAYTPGGAGFARAHGVPEHRLTVVMNTVDSSALEREMRAVTDGEIAAFAGRHQLPNGPYLAYIGGIDQSKRIDLLAAALDILHARGSKAHVVVAGRGAQIGLLDEARQRGQVSLLGYADDHLKAQILSGAVAIVNPGRIGLVAVEALVSHRPVISTEWEWHAPEIEYLERGSTLIVTEDTAKAFASALDAAVLGSPSFEAINWPQPPRLTDMVENFRLGTLSLLSC